IPLLAEEGSATAKGWSAGREARAARSASAIARSLKNRAKPQLVVSSAKCFGRSDHPVCAFAALGASTPPLRGGNELSIQPLQFDSLVVFLEYLFVCCAVQSHTISTDLTHTDTVSPATAVEHHA